MKTSHLSIIIVCLTLLACGEKNEDQFIFFLHNRFLEEHGLNEFHPEFGRTEYIEILSEFENEGFKVISEKRNGKVKARHYALGIVNKIDSLIEKGTEPKRITIVGTPDSADLQSVPTQKIKVL